MAMPQARSQKDCLLHLLFLRLPEHPGKGQSSQQTIRHEAITHKLKNSEVLRRSHRGAGSHRSFPTFW
jgi:hypothetical protein